MIHTKFQDQWSFGSGEDIFEGFYHIYGRCGHFGVVTQISKIHFLSLHIQFGFD